MVQISYSSGKHLLRSVAHWRHARTHREDTAALTFGRAVHTLILGGDAIVEVEYDTYRTDAAKQVRDTALREGKIPLKPDELAPAKECAAAVTDHPTAAKWIAAATEKEVDLGPATDPDTGVQIRGRADLLVPVGDVICPVDIKTVQDATPAAMFRDVAKHHYDLQGAFYRRLIEARGDISGPMVIIAVEKAPPYLVAVYQLAHEDMIDAGQIKMSTVLSRAATIDSADWDGYPLGTHTLQPHGWYLTSITETYSDSED